MFKSAYPDLPLPNPVYLKIRAACYYMDKFLEELEDIRVLSEDGSSGWALSFTLQYYRQDVVGRTSSQHAGYKSLFD